MVPGTAAIPPILSATERVALSLAGIRRAVRMATVLQVRAEMKTGQAAYSCLARILEKIWAISRSTVHSLPPLQLRWSAAELTASAADERTRQEQYQGGADWLRPGALQEPTSRLVKADAAAL